MHNYLIKNSFVSRIYLIFYSLFLFIMTFTLDSQLNGSAITNLDSFTFNLGLYAFILVNIIYIFLNSTIKDIKITVCIILLVIAPDAFSMFNNQVISPFFLLICLMIINVKNHVSPKGFIKVDFFTRLISIVLIIFLSTYNLLPSNYNITTRYGVIRDSFGFADPNTAGLTITGLVISFVLYSIFLKNRVYKYIIFAILFVSSYSFIYFTDSRECEITLILLLVYLFIKDIFFIKNLVLNFPLPALIISVIFSISCTFFISPYTSLYNKINKLLTHRMSGWYLDFKIYPAQLLGRNHIPLIKSYKAINPNSEFSFGDLDNGYMYTLMRTGIIGLIILISLFIYICYQLRIYDKYLFSFCFTIILVMLTVTQYKDSYLFLPYFISLCGLKKLNCVNYNKKKVR